MSAQGSQWEEFGKEFDEHYPNVWERFDWSFTGFVALSQSIILNYALKDNVSDCGKRRKLPPERGTIFPECKDCSATGAKA